MCVNLRRRVLKSQRLFLGKISGEWQVCTIVKSENCVCGDHPLCR